MKDIKIRLEKICTSSSSIIKEIKYVFPNVITIVPNDAHALESVLIILCETIQGHDDEIKYSIHYSHHILAGEEVYWLNISPEDNTDAGALKATNILTLHLSKAIDNYLHITKRKP